VTSFSTKYKIGERQLTNPIVVAPCPATEDCERLLHCADARVGTAILKSCHTISNSPKDKGRRFQVSERGLWETSTLAASGHNTTTYFTGELL